ncbi:tryptophan dimethylallyltransferase-domain-containing protein [Hypoxylon sp. FL1284]|nr:tryptophan dimethylallyltransferase-domain-containing protein [Hypoxylon sp. FL1284]
MAHNRGELEVHAYSSLLPLSLMSYLLSLKSGLESLLLNCKPESLLPNEPKTAWEHVNAEFYHQLDRHAQHWWQRSGHALAVLLREAGYNDAAQAAILDFFARHIADNLGSSTARHWKSFMTDDHNPIELSWDWHTGSERPTVRFSIEPLGPDAGGPEGPRNECAAATFKRAMRAALPDADAAWFDHFEAFFSCQDDDAGGEGHPSRVFWAFDLASTGRVASKAYFFLGPRARTTGSTNLQILIDAIAAASSCSRDKLAALDVFAAYALSCEQERSTRLELDMLAIDMDDRHTLSSSASSPSRLKIYFRGRQTSFRSVREAMTLGAGWPGPTWRRGSRA